MVDRIAKSRWRDSDVLPRLGHLAIRPQQPGHHGSRNSRDDRLANPLARIDTIENRQIRTSSVAVFVKATRTRWSVDPSLVWQPIRPRRIQSNLRHQPCVARSPLYDRPSRGTPEDPIHRRTEMESSLAKSRRWMGWPIRCPFLHRGNSVGNRIADCVHFQACIDAPKFQAIIGLRSCSNPVRNPIRAPLAFIRNAIRDRFSCIPHRVLLCQALVF